MKTHGLSKHPLYWIWRSIKQRCYNKKRKDYSKYGKRGIKIEKEWKHNFQKFYNWFIENGWKPKLHTDRIDNNKGYLKTNIRFVSISESNNNKRNNIKLTFKNKTQNLKQWARQFNINRHTLKQRLDNGWSLEKALLTPTRKIKGK